MAAALVAVVTRYQCSAPVWCWSWVPEWEPAVDWWRGGAASLRQSSEMLVKLWEKRTLDTMVVMEKPTLHVNELWGQQTGPLWHPYHLPNLERQSSSSYPVKANEHYGHTWSHDPHMKSHDPHTITWSTHMVTWSTYMVTWSTHCHMIHTHGHNAGQLASVRHVPSRQWFPWQKTGQTFWGCSTVWRTAPQAFCISRVTPPGRHQHGHLVWRVTSE